MEYRFKNKMTSRGTNQILKDEAERYRQLVEKREAAAQAKAKAAAARLSKTKKKHEKLVNLANQGERDALKIERTAYATTLASISLVTLRESGALGIGGPSAGRFVTGTMEYLVAARSCLALRDGQVVQKPKIRGWRGRAGRAADCAKAFD